MAASRAAKIRARNRAKMTAAVKCVTYESDEKLDEMVADGKLAKGDADAVKEFAEFLRQKDQG